MTGTVLSQEAERFDAVEFSVPLYMDAQRLIYKSPVLTSDIAGFIKPYTGLVSFRGKAQWVNIFDTSGIVIRRRLF